MKERKIQSDVTIKHMPSPETQRVRSVEHFVEVDGVGVAITREGGKLWLSVSGSKEYIAEIKEDRQHILEVLKEGVSKMYEDRLLGVRVNDILTLLQETLGEGKEINSIFKE